MKLQSLRGPIALALALAFASGAQAQTEIQWWHSMSGALGDWVGDIAKDYNSKQRDYKIVPVFKGSYDESMTAAVAAFRAGNAPHILQVFEVGTATMMASKGVVVPVEQVMREAGYKFDPKAYVPAVAGYYTAPSGQMMSFPFNSSTTVMWVNLDAFKAAGLPTDKLPRTWPEVTLAAAKLKASGHQCPFTTAWQGWTQLESFSTWHDTELATQGNGMKGLNARLVVNSPLHVRHIENLGNMAKQGLFVYKGRGSAAGAPFESGECAISINSSAAYAGVSKNAKFKFAVGTLPYYPDVPNAPQNTVIGGASLWVMSGKKPAEYKGIASFFNYLSDPAVQAANHKRTGYLPVTMAAFRLTEQSGFYQQNPGTDVSVNQMIRKTTEKSRGIRLGNYVQIRTIEDEELEQVWAGKKSAKAALDSIVQRGNELLVKFEKANKS
ncbi:sn-glycerol-3-phosphate ABC transporter substrate-binding protein UgpB [Malikia granosa]|uniref:sn-glycerol-3-phosphate-binding periplasmic protein UgpB n=1 Tax=Malikia granosa TaxID=263067 RepID=A0A2S9K671_9BURK|nr:sn-glycerol-3-phosphate ABC transporter substrate-binding protein UgpB [Malikia granosa]PRD65956.1 sn-glycerol-3-phosphate ABC transporter substrate-binding protein UgpB [Malikia granosa]